MVIGKIRGADIVYSPDEGIWWGQMFEQDDRYSLPIEVGPDSPEFTSKLKAERWAMGHGATILLYPGDR